ncbi:MAG: exodeoxyribonuclease III, partial [Flavobacteriaceae bacterium]|nr:exodeoxyribonuclease III [Flavobacteriaceae bacterium]
MKIFSYNVNGIRAAIRKGFLEWLKEYNPDVICLQEIKANTDQLDINLFNEIGYENNYWFSAQKKGYSGVAILSKHKPLSIQYGTGIDHMDFEGRNLRLDFEKFSVMSLYLPSGTNLNRLAYKFKYMKEFYDYILNLKKTIPNMIICGDYN